MKELIIIILSYLHYLTFVPTNIEIYTDQPTGKFNDNILGNNLIGYDPKTYEKGAKEYYGYSDYGAGIWDPKHHESVKEVIDLAKDAGISILRFPGGCGTHQYNWKNAIGKERGHFLYGLDEFLKTCEEIGAEAVITVSFFTGDEQDAADLVEYLNGKATEGVGSRVKGQSERVEDDGSRVKGVRPGGKNWAEERVENGHPEPYGVKYFEIGNEVYHGDHRTIKHVLPEEYARRYLKYYDAMKSVDPSIKIGVVLHTLDWNRKVLEIVKDRIDFGIIHTYPSPQVSNEQLDNISGKDIFSITLSMPVLKDEYFFQDTLKLLKEKSGRDIPLAITEYNGGFVQERPVPYRHCLGTALLNAELLRIFTKQENNILMANYWQFCNSYWGMIKSKGDFSNQSYLNYRTPINYYIKRPNYYVYELYHKHFCGKLVKTKVTCNSYDVMNYKNHVKNIFSLGEGDIISDNLLPEEWSVQELEGVTVRKDESMLTIYFINPIQFNYYHSNKRVRIEPNSYYKVSGYIKVDNLVDESGVCLVVQDGRGWTATHSAVSTKKLTGTTDWQYVEAIYETLSDANEVMVIVRRVGEKGPLKGKVSVKDVKLNKFQPKIDIPYLSVNASINDDKNKVYLMVINKNMDAPMTATIDLKDFAPAEEGDAWVLNGPSVDATNEKKHDNVKVMQHEFEIKGNQFEFTFEPHSLTAIEIEGKKE